MLIIIFIMDQESHCKIDYSVNLLPGESEKTWDAWRTVTSHLADCRELNLSVQPNSNLGDKPSPIQIRHLMHLLKKILFVRPFMGVLQTGEIFSQAPSAFYHGKSHMYMGYYQGGMKKLGNSIFSPGMSYHTSPYVENIDNVWLFVLLRGFFQADQRSADCNATSCRQTFS